MDLDTLVKGKLITLEGGEGSGKSTQIKFIRAFLDDRKIVSVVTREPGGTAIGEKIRDILKDPENIIDPETELTLILASRREHIINVIKPTLDSGAWVICDRFSDSTYAYQAGGRQISFQKISELERLLSVDLQPDITFWLDVDCLASKIRLAERGFDIDRFEIEKPDFFTRVNQTYYDLYINNQKRIYRIDAGLQSNIVTSQITTILGKFMKGV